MYQTQLKSKNLKKVTKRVWCRIGSIDPETGARVLPPFIMPRGGPMDTIYTDYTDFIHLLIDFL